MRHKVRFAKHRHGSGSWLDDRERQWKAAAGLTLLAGILSLVASIGPNDDGWRSEPAGRACSPAGETPRRAMDSQPMLEPVDRPVGMTAAGDPIAQRVGWSSPGPPAAEAGVVEAPRTRSLFLRSHLESVIQQHPWPTLLLGIAAGYLLARRLR